MKYLLVLLLLVGGLAHGQSTIYLRSDTVKIMKQSGNNELYIQNGTKAIKGVLTNTGNGLTRFIASRTSGDTLFIGMDTLIGIGAAGWKLTGNTGLNDSVNFIGTTDDESLRFKTNGVNSGLVGNRGSTFFGYGTGTGVDSTGNHDSTGYRNTMFGYMAGANYAGSGATTAIGFEANKTGISNSDIFIGFRTGKYAYNASFRNVIIGLNGGYFINGDRNTGVGVFNMENLRTGSSNTSIGEGAGRYATDADYNTSLGAAANHNSTTWIDTIIVTAGGSGYTSDPTVVISAPCDATAGWPFGTDQATATAVRTGDAVTSIVMVSRGGRYSTNCPLTVSFTGGGGSGATATAYLKSGNNNTAVGFYSLFANSNGNNNTAVGMYAGYGGTPGSDNNTTRDSLTLFLGYNAVRSSTIPTTTKLTNAGAIGANATVAASNAIVIGAINGTNGATINTRVGIGVVTPLDRLHVGARVSSDSGFLNRNITGTALNAGLSNTDAFPPAVFARNASSGTAARSGIRMTSNDGSTNGDVTWENTANTSYIAEGNGLLLLSGGVGGIKTVVGATRSIKFGHAHPGANSNTVVFWRDSVIAYNVESATLGTYNSILVYDSATSYGAAGTGHVKYVPVPSILSTTVASASNTPAVTGITNVDNVSTGQFHWMRVGNVVNYSGFVNIDATVAGTATSVEVTLNYASNFASNDDAAGVVTEGISGAAQSSGYIYSNSTSDKIVINVTPQGTAAQGYYVSGSYKII